MNIRLIETLNTIVSNVATASISDIEAERAANKAIRKAAQAEELRLADYDSYLDNFDNAASGLRKLARISNSKSQLEIAKSFTSIIKHFDEVISHNAVDATL